MMKTAKLITGVWQIIKLKKNIKSVFMNIDMYRDEELNKEDPSLIMN